MNDEEMFDTLCEVYDGLGIHDMDDKLLSVIDALRKRIQGQFQIPGRPPISPYPALDSED